MKNTVGDGNSTAGGCEGSGDMWQGTFVISDMSPCKIPQLARSQCWKNAWFDG